MSIAMDPAAGMPLTEHLRDLRKRLVRCLALVAVVFAGLFPFAQTLYTLISEPLRRFLPEGASMIATSVTSPFLTPFKLTAMCALFVAMPLLLHQAWGFLAPGLYRRERRIALPLLVSSIVLFYAGMAFAFFLVFPMMFGFFCQRNAGRRGDDDRYQPVPGLHPGAVPGVRAGVRDPGGDVHRGLGGVGRCSHTEAQQALRDRRVLCGGDDPDAAGCVFADDAGGADVGAVRGGVAGLWNVEAA